MKIHFALATNGSHHRESCFARLWEEWITNLKQDGTRHSITDNIHAADIAIDVIDNSIESFESPAIVSLLKPLSRTDIQRFVWDWGDRPTGRSSGFFCSLDRALFDHARHRTVHYPVPFNELVDEYPTSDTIYDYGFMGGITAGVRTRLVEFLQSIPADSRTFMKVTEFNWPKAFDRKDNTDARREYVEFLRRTRFVLCPRGYGLGTARLFETLRAGRVPIIISDRYVLPSGIDWESCSLRIAEKDIQNIPDAVRKLCPSWEKMAKRAREVWYQTFSHDHFFRYLTDNLETMLNNLHPPSLIDRSSFMAKTALAVTSQHLRPCLGGIKKSILEMRGFDGRRPRQRTND